MNKLIPVFIVILTGCAANAQQLEITHLRKQNAEMLERFDRLMDKTERLEGKKDVPTSLPVQQTPAPVVNIKANSSTSAMLVRSQHGPYMGASGQQPRQFTKGPKFKIVNKTCERHSRNLASNCLDLDQDGAPDYMYVALYMDGHPVACDGLYLHPANGMKLLGPEETCFIEVGSSTTVKFSAVLFRNIGTYNQAFPEPGQVLEVSKPLRSASFVLSADGLINLYTIDEDLFH